MNLGADVALANIATTVTAAHQTRVSQADFKKAANDGDSFSDCLKARGDAAEEADQAGATPAAAAPEKTTEDRSTDEDAADSATAPQGLGLVATLLQTILAMPPKSDRNAPADVEAAAVSGGLAAVGADVVTPGLAPAPDAKSLAQQKNLPGSVLSDAAMPTPATQADVSALTSAHDTVPEALLAMLNAPAAAVTGTDRAAAAATPAASHPLSHGELAEPLAERIVWMSDTARANGAGSLQEARISLHPAELGSLQIKVELSADGSTKVSFDVQTAQARQAIEASLPQLRELLAPNLVNAATASFQLSGGLSQQQQQASSQPAWRGGSQRDGDANEVQNVTPVATRRRIGLLDQFA